MSSFRRFAAWRETVLRAEARWRQRAAHLGPAGWRLPACLALIAFSILQLGVADGFANGDAAVYAEQIETRSFAERSVHIGYTAISAALLAFPDHVPASWLNRLAALFGALTLGLMAHLAWVVTGRRSAAVAVAVAMLANWTVVREMLGAEVYGAQGALLTLAAWCWLRAQSAASGVALAASVLHSPTSLFAVPAFVVARPVWRRVVTLGVVGGGLTLVVIATVWRDYFFGARGLLAASERRMPIVEMVIKEGVEGLFGVLALLPFVVLGAWRLVRRRQGRPALGAWLVLWAVTFVFGERVADVPVQWPTWLGLTLFAVIGLREMEVRLRAARHRPWVVVVVATVVGLAPLAALVVFRARSSVFGVVESWMIMAMAALVLSAAGLAWFWAGRWPRRAARTLFGGAAGAGLVLVATLAAHQQASIDGYRHDVLALRPTFTVSDDRPPSAFAVGGWSRAILFERYLFSTSYTGRVINVEWWSDGGGEQGEAARQQRDAATAAGSEIWLLGHHPGPRQDLEALGYHFETLANGFERGRPSTPIRPEPTLSSPIPDEEMRP